jgi:hypothetical protein
MLTRLKRQSDWLRNHTVNLDNFESKDPPKVSRSHDLGSKSLGHLFIASSVASSKVFRSRHNESVKPQ